LTDPDYVVIGAGSSGCALVHRLSLDPSIRILVLEAGVSGEGDPSVLAPGRWVSLMGSSYDWGYTTEPEPGLDGRRIAVPRGKAFGGSSAINAMVHVRGSRSCFDSWRASGNPGWSYDELTPFLARDRQLAIVQGDDPHDSHAAFLRAAGELGFGVNPARVLVSPDTRSLPSAFSGSTRRRPSEMVRSVRPFAALIVCLSLVAITNAQGPNDRFGQFWGQHIQPAPPTIGLRGLAINTSQTSTAPVSGDMLHHWKKCITTC